MVQGQAELPELLVPRVPFEPEANQSGVRAPPKRGYDQDGQQRPQGEQLLYRHDNLFFPGLTGFEDLRPARSP